MKKKLRPHDLPDKTSKTRAAFRPIIERLEERALLSADLNIQVLGSVTGQAGTFTNNLSSLNLSPGATINYEVVIQFAPSGTINANTAKTPNGTTDSVNSLPTFTLVDAGGGTFNTATENSTLTGGSGARLGATGSSTLASNRAIAAPGVFVNADTLLTLITGTFTTGANTAAITASTDAGTAGSIKLAGSLTAITTGSEASADPLLAYSSLLIAKPTPSVALTAPASGLYNGNMFAASATVNGSAAVDGVSPTLSYYAGSTVNGSALGGAPTNAGVYTVVANFAGSANFGSASSAPATFTIGKVALTATATASNKTYDGTTAANVSYALSGFVGTETVAASGAGTFSGANAGNSLTVTLGAVTLANGTNGGLAGNYTLAAPANPTANITAEAITATATAANKTYDGTTAANVTYTLGGLVGSETVTATSSATFASANVGNGLTVTLGAITLADGANGGLASNYVLTTPANPLANITAKALTATATATNKVYDSTTVASVSYVLSGFVGTETVTASGTGTFAGANVGNGLAVTLGAITVADGANGGLAGNYTVAAPANPTANITAKSLTATATAVNKTYDGTTAASVSYVLSGLVGTETITASGAGAFASANVGSGLTVTLGAITLANGANGGLAGNYVLTTPANPTANITAKTLTAIATAANKTYDGTTAANVSYALNGFVGTETVTASSTGTFASANVGSGQVVTLGAITLANGANGGLASNYVLTTPANPVANIAAKALTATATASNKVYDGATSATVSYVLSGFVGTETITASGTGTFAGANAGNNVSVILGAVTLANGTNGGVASNYVLTTPANPTANITKAALTVTANPASKTYGTANPAFSDVIAGYVNNETVSVVSGTASLSTTATSSSGVGSYPITAAQGTLAATNYSFNFAGSSLTVNAATLVVKANNATMQVGASSLPAFSDTITGFVNGDLASVVSGTASLATTATTASPVGPYPITAAIGNLAASNYTFTFVGGTLTVTSSQAPTFASSSIAFTPAETASLNSAIGVVTATPAYTGQKLTYSLTGADAALFTINSTTGAITAKNALNLQARSTPYNFNIVASGLNQATPATLVSGSAAVTVTVMDVPTTLTVGSTVGSQSVKDNATIAPLTTVKIGDVISSHMDTVTLALSDATNGGFTAASLTASGFKSTGAGLYSLTATPANLDTALAKLVYQPAANHVAPGAAESTTITVSVTDGIQTSPTTNNATKITIVSVNDAPVISGAVAGQKTTDNASIAAFSKVTIADADSGQTLTVTVKLDTAAKGTLSGGGFTGSNGVYTFSGGAAAATAAIRALSFTPTAHRVAVGKSETTTFTVNVSDGIVTTTNNATTVVTTAATTAPTISGVTTTPQPINDTQTVAPFATVTLTDVNASPTLVVTITLSNKLNGSLSGAFHTVTGSGIYTFSGTTAAAQAAIRALVFHPTAHQATPGSTITTGFTLKVADGAVSATNTQSSVVTTARNTSPTVTGTATLVRVNDNQTVKPFTAVVIADADFGQTATVTTVSFASGNGSFTAASLAASHFVAVAGSPGAYAFTGAAAQAQIAIRQLVFSPTRGQVARGKTVTTNITISVDDQSGGMVTNTATNVISTAV